MHLSQAQIKTATDLAYTKLYSIICDMGRCGGEQYDNLVSQRDEIVSLLSVLDTEFSFSTFIQQSFNPSKKDIVKNGKVSIVQLSAIK